MSFGGRLETLDLSALLQTLAESLQRYESDFGPLGAAGPRHEQR